MICIRNIFCFVISIFSIADVIKAFQESIVDSGIVITEEAIRNTTNKLFSTLKLKRDNPRLNQYLTINKHFASITIGDNDNLNKIFRLSRAGTKSNGTTIFMTAINELLNDDYIIVNNNVVENKINNGVVTESHDDHVVDIIESFLKRLREARELHDVNLYVNINERVLNLIKEAQTTNATAESEHNDHYIDRVNTTSEEMEFWKPSGRRIFGGARTKIKHFPFMASIQIFNNFQCAGSIIKSDLVITASSCLQLAWNNRFFRENPAFLSVRVGSSFYSGGGEVISVLEVYFHPSYDPKTLRNNICIVRLTRKIKFSWRARKKVRKIDIDRKANILPFNTPGVTILGWGAKGRSNVVRDPWSNILSFAHLDIYPLNDCQEIYSKEYVTHKNFCAGFISRGGGACNRDIGGPGIDDGILIGVVSFGSPVCGAADAPTVFTKLGFYADWIEEIMDQEVPYSRKRTTAKPKKPSMEIRHTALTTTTFKVPPLPGGKMKPIPINQVDHVLRIFDDDLFHEFMRTMFDSKEMAEYQDVFKEVKQDMVSEIMKDGMQQHGKQKEEKQIVKEDKQLVKEKKQIRQDEKQLNNEEPSRITSPFMEFSADTATKLIDFDAESVEISTESSKLQVTSGEIGPKRENVDNGIADLIKNIDLKKIIEEESLIVNKNEGNGDTESIFFDEAERPPDYSKKNESVLTLLYLSEENKDKEKDVEVSIENGKGLSIATDTFQDLTRSKDKIISNYNGLPEKELYEILSEVIDDEIRNSETKL